MPLQPETVVGDATAAPTDSEGARGVRASETAARQAARQAVLSGSYRVDPEAPNEVLLRDAAGRLLQTIEVRLVYPLGVARRHGEVCEAEKRTAEKIAAMLNADYRALQVALLRERAQVHRGDAMTLECSNDFLSPDQRAAIDWHARQARALCHEAELIEKAPPA